MRPPHPDLEKICFQAENAELLISLMGSECSDNERDLIREYCAKGLPPVTSVEALSTMFGYNPGFVWSILKRTERHYRIFSIPKGKSKERRPINAPRVGLKSIQRWLAFHWTKLWTPCDSVFGFVPGRSHVKAAQMHVNAEWKLSADITNFFPSVLEKRVEQSLRLLGYRDENSISIIIGIICLDGGLTQGAPTSPIISNVALSSLDTVLLELSKVYGSVYTRYADDIVFSGKGEIPEGIERSVVAAIEGDGWRISEKKFHISKLPARLKVHGLLVHGKSVRLTKGYRNRIRAYRHLLKAGKIAEADRAVVLGHVAYCESVEKAGF
jgi:RNA-directed DNA polymerase